jgi:GNAT superfamily N-acetyltransferase
MSYSVRPAKEEDVLDIVFSVKQFAKEIPHLAWSKFDNNKVKDIVTSLVTSEHGFVYVAVNDKGEVVGALIGLLSGIPINDLVFAQELMFWVDPNHRNGKTAPRLIDEYVKWAKNSGATFSRLSALDEVLEGRAGVLFKRKGFKAIETAYVKEL